LAASALAAITSEATAASISATRILGMGLPYVCFRTPSPNNTPAAPELCSPATAGFRSRYAVWHFAI
jgi:hypothetical protein